MFPLLIPSWPPGVRGVFTTRAGGASLPPYAELNLGDHVGDDQRTVRANRAAVAGAMGSRPSAWCSWSRCTDGTSPWSTARPSARRSWMPW